ncbi:exonuclease [Escherichia coli O157:H7]|nr:hypothetical protein BY95_17925 [Escherichia coli O157:H7 str. K6687]MBL5119481.1 exonuclease [Escherichia coli O157:H7]MBL5233850.1 exonuclease [Escherichia coli O157:H7]MBL5347062.1 exonuclease [Escherichia coli O157:H7]MBL5365034.1 exonuclease [Escherichia coli O157:H7]
MIWQPEFTDKTLSRKPGAVQREGLHYVVIERNEKYMASFDEMVPEFIEKMDEALAEIGFVYGEQW